MGQRAGVVLAALVSLAQLDPVRGTESSCRPRRECLTRSGEIKGRRITTTCCAVVGKSGEQNSALRKSASRHGLDMLRVQRDSQKLSSANLVMVYGGSTTKSRQRG